MPTKKMLIDTTHPEETRVVVLNGNLLEDFDAEVESKKQLKGNVYLAKVIRVEPSLQAAFVDFGGNRHGFLSFSEIHPDYYQLPVADREAMVAEHDAAEQEDESIEADENAENNSTAVETVGGDDSDEVEARRARPSLRRYKIQEVIKRRQILLVQVVKEERGNKGAALTTCLSLAGRYCVLMPNTARGGGISRKISNGPERKKLKTIINDLEIPKGMAVIVRTAGSKRSKTEIKRDYEYLMRLWNTIRELTLKSTAPDLIHEEGNLIKRSIRDIYNNEISEIIVSGDKGYRIAKNFMKLMIPSHAKKVQPYSDTTMPMLRRYQVEDQLNAIHSPTAQLKSGGYIVINQTEALVAVDVNSGRSTKERSIEETALKTNLEAVDEFARQVRLRDLAGLLVIDFIDMEVSRNNTKVERRLKDAMRNDRARVQLGRISHFGLMELSRQRLRPSIIETSSDPCPYCDGTGIRRSTDSAALFVLRTIEEEVAKGCASEIIVHTQTAVALYILNHKRASLTNIETRNNMTIAIANDDSLIPPKCRIEQINQQTATTTGDKNKTNVPETADNEDDNKKRRKRRPRRHGRHDNGSDNNRSTPAETTDLVQTDAKEDIAKPQNIQNAQSPQKDDGEAVASKRRRRGRRGGRRRSRRPTNADATNAVNPHTEISEAAVNVPAADTLPEVSGEPVIAVSADTDIKTTVEKSPNQDPTNVKKPKRPRRAAVKKVVATTKVKADDKAAAKPLKRGKPAPKTAKTSKVKDKKKENDKTNVIDVGKTDNVKAIDKKPRKGWWNRLTT